MDYREASQMPWNNRSYNRSTSFTNNKTSFDKNKTESKRYLTFEDLQEWSAKDPKVISNQLIAQQKVFEAVLSFKALSGDKIVLIVEILAKLCSIKNNNHKIKVLNSILSCNFMMKMQKYIWELQLQEDEDRRQNKYFWRDPNRFFKNSSFIIETLLETCPGSAFEVLPKFLKAIQTIIPYLETRLIKISDDINHKFVKIQETFLCSQMDFEKHTYQPSNKVPVDNFRQLSVYPSYQDVLSCKEIFIRKHLIGSAYDNCDHYLDVQFRLLKEDFMINLRKGIADFIKFRGMNRSDKQDVEIYPHVEFISPRFVDEHNGVLVQIHFNKETDIDNKTAQFLCGSLLCFTKDNFTTVLFGKVVDQNSKILEKGQIIVDFERTHGNYKLHTPYIMVDSCINFQSLYTVLKALQSLRDETFPLKNYIINVNSNSEPPAYLNSKSIFTINKFLVPLFVSRAWPSANQLNFDDAQLSAFKAALTERLSIIIGPPGTGKTYIASQIVKTLVLNKNHWYDGSCLPILIICRSNYALDRLLEGLICYSDNIVRIGISKNKTLPDLSLCAKRKHLYNTSTTNCGVMVLRRDLEVQLERMKDWNYVFDMLENYDGILSFKHFVKFAQGFLESWFKSASDALIIEWLLGTQVYNKTPLVRANKAWIARIKNGSDCKTPENDGFPLNVKFKFGKLIGQSKPTCLISLPQMKQHAEHIKMELARLQNKEAEVVKRIDLENYLRELQYDMNYLEIRLSEGKMYQSKCGRSGELIKITDINMTYPHRMTPENRWKLYFYWFDLYKKSIFSKVTQLQKKYQEMYKYYLESKNVDDAQILKQMLVVGTTIEDAVINHNLLQELQSPIVLVEEATEILESHLIVSLTQNCQHLILIGDDKKKLTVTSDKMTSDYNLGVSLLERMKLNKLHTHTLKVQRSMRPELFDLITSVFYEDSVNYISHESVCNFEPVSGVEKCLYFVNQALNIQDAVEQNLYSAKFIITFANYLILNGYRPDDITILALHPSSLEVLLQVYLTKEFLLKEVLITTPENVKGRACKIVLLSLVGYTNNIAKSENNDLQVALAGAKEGLYMFGNIENLCSNGMVWLKIKKILEAKQNIGSSIPLRCQVHPDVVTRMESVDNFKEIFENFCNRVCGIELVCGHQCTKTCHLADRAHLATKCNQLCSKIVCNNNHKCSKLCYEDCETCQAMVTKVLPCGHEHYLQCSTNLTKHYCTTLVTCKLLCGHEVSNKPCYVDPALFKCPFKCNKLLGSCGHNCDQSDPEHTKYACSKPCPNIAKDCSTKTHMCPKTCSEECPSCRVVVEKLKSECLHSLDIACSTNVDEITCMKICGKMLSCKHRCRLRCYENCGYCKVLVDKQLPQCGHMVKSKCSEEASKSNCKQQCTLMLKCGHLCQNRCNESCTTECSELVDHTKLVDCGHEFKIPCHLLNKDIPSSDYGLLQFCPSPCRTKLKCGHFCSGTCSKCAQGRIHQSCKEKCQLQLICGHPCSRLCREACLCTKLCRYKCEHGICRKTCGKMCVKCTEPCRRVCNHTRCGALCGDKCTVPPCNIPCPKKLKCTHSCVGFCGEPCPPLCIICNRNELTEDSEISESRFVLLLDCKHIIENQVMERWLMESENMVTFKSCPKCKTPIILTRRYREYAKTTVQDIINIKEKYFLIIKDGEAKRKDLLCRLHGLCRNLPRLIPGSAKVIRQLTKVKAFIDVTKVDIKQPLNTFIITLTSVKIQILENIIKIFQFGKLRQTEFKHKVTSYIKFLLECLLHHELHITNQVISDFKKELRRLARIIQLGEIEDCNKFLSTVTANKSAAELHQNVKELIFRATVYEDNDDINVCEMLCNLSRLLSTSFGIIPNEFLDISFTEDETKFQWEKCQNEHFFERGIKCKTCCK